MAFLTWLRWLFRGEIPLSRLKTRGLTVGKNFSRQRGCIIDPSHCWLITIEDNVTLAPRVHILAHDASTKRDLGHTVIGKVKIGSNVFVGAGAIILPDTTIGDDVVIGAGSVITGDIPSGVVVAGNPARVIASKEKFVLKHKRQMELRPVFDGEYTIARNISQVRKKEMRSALEEGIGYVA